MFYTNNTKKIKNSDLDIIFNRVVATAKASLPSSIINKMVVNFDDSEESYATSPHSEKININIGVGLASRICSEYSLGPEMIAILVEGLLWHELSHIMYTDYKTLDKIFSEHDNIKQPMMDMLTDYINEGNESKKNQIKNDIAEMYRKISHVSIKKNYLNAMEDGYIENAIKKHSKHARNSVNTLRYYNTLDNLSFIDENQFSYMSNDVNSFFSSVFAEILSASTMLLEDNIFDNITGGGFDVVLSKYMDKDIAESSIILCNYSRFDAKSSWDVMASLDVYFDNFSKAIFYESQIEEFNKVFDSWIENYQNFENNIDELINNSLSSASNLPMNSSDDFMPPSNDGGSSEEQANSQSRIYLPKELQNKINEKKKEYDNKDSDGDSNKSEDSESDSNSDSSDRDSNSSSDKTNSSDEGDSSEIDNSSQQSSLKELLDEIKEEDKLRNEESSKSIEESLKKLSEKYERESKERKINKANEDIINSMKREDGRRPERKLGGYFDNSINQNAVIHFKKLDESQNMIPKIAEIKKMNNQSYMFSRPLSLILERESKTKYEYNLRAGDELNVAALPFASRNPKIFQKKLVGKKNKTRIAILVDCSGSMSYRNNMDKAKEAAYVLARSLQEIGIPFQLWGHNTSGGSRVNIYESISFSESKDKSRLNNIWTMDSGGANWDSVAFGQLATELKANQGSNDEELHLWVISDGSPSASYDYSGEAAEKDLYKTVDFFKNHFNINTIGIGIGDDVEHVSNIYKNSIIVKNVNQLTEQLLKTLRKILM